MALVPIRCTEHEGKRKAGLNREGFIATRHWTIQYAATNNEVEVAFEQSGFNGLPKFGAVHPSHSGLYLFNISVQVLQSKGNADLWSSTHEYSKLPYDVHDVRTFSDPLDAPTQVVWDEVISQVPIDIDADGDALVNPNGEPFDPPMTETYFDEKVTITKNYETFTPLKAVSWRGRVNTDTWTVDGNDIAPGLAKITSCRFFNEVTPDGLVYIKVITVVGIRNAIGDDTVGWLRHVVNKGFTYEDGGDIFIAEDDQGNPLNEPIQLNANGTKNETGNPTFTDYKTYKEIDFTAEEII